jgi:hypothetical protein
VRTVAGDGNEGGRHQVIKATVSGGKLYMIRGQVRCIAGSPGLMPWVCVQDF